MDQRMNTVIPVGTQVIFLNHRELAIPNMSTNTSPQNQQCHTDAVCPDQTRYYRKR
jgi:hypothetical protein